jgi:hypothetical protein
MFISLRYETATKISPAAAANYIATENSSLAEISSIL